MSPKEAWCSPRPSHRGRSIKGQRVHATCRYFKLSVPLTIGKNRPRRNRLQNPISNHGLRRRRLRRRRLRKNRASGRRRRFPPNRAAPQRAPQTAPAPAPAAAKKTTSAPKPIALPVNKPSQPGFLGRFGVRLPFGKDKFPRRQAELQSPCLSPLSAMNWSGSAGSFPKRRRRRRGRARNSPGNGKRRRARWWKSGKNIPVSRRKSPH